MTRAARQNSTGGEGERRRQARATPKKRKGVCWGQPVLTTADHIDSEDECQDIERFDVLCGASLGEPNHLRIEPSKAFHAPKNGL